MSDKMEGHPLPPERSNSSADLRDEANVGEEEDHAAIEIRDLALKRDGMDILSGVSFSVPTGQFACLLGPSGVGKSSLLRIIGDLIPFSEGDVRIGGRKPSEAWRELAYVFQNPRLVPWRSARRNVELGMLLRDGRSKGRQEREDEVLGLLRLCRMDDSINKPALALSGGERQRVAIARALAVQPRVLLLDEPFGALDVRTRQHLGIELLEVWRSTGLTILFVTHDLSEAVLLADRILLMGGKPGRLLLDTHISWSRPRDLNAKPIQSLRQKLLELAQHDDEIPNSTDVMENPTSTHLGSSLR